MNAVILTISDSRKPANDLSGVTLAGLLIEMHAVVVEKLIISDELDDIRNTLHVLTERDDVDVVITTGGTGLGPRDNTPEATRAVIDREAPGIAEAMRRETSRDAPLAMLSRGICGSRNNTLIINLPGSPKAVEECFAVIRPVLEHAVQILSGKTQH
ncbi:MAG TPA: MogA/MoaB family molybdenum cofactor biosynthesis protein [Pyrinomonadaceae bacterium]|jgi:molybdenum cofactor synthesis domain-containing protein|nr:MogA/MoaB family molybdenum cofactor biosynthesis protein [Pyrinomonadaceae bacterium]